MSPPPPPKHVPAWLKLGLKLKNAPESPQQPAAPTNGISHNAQTNGKKRKAAKLAGVIESAALVEEPRTKKNKVKSSSRESEGEKVNGSVKTAGKVIENGKVNGLKSLKRKSVNFASDVKADDGESVKQMHGEWVATQRGNDPTFDTKTLSPALKLLSPESSTSKSTSTPTPNTNTNPPPPQNNLNPTTTPPPPHSKNKLTRKIKPPPPPKQPNLYHALTYLTTHHTSPTTWKFNKTHQKTLLAHLFHPPTLPPAYDKPLLPYLRGLESVATKSRLREAALAVREEDRVWLSSSSSSSTENTTATEVTTATSTTPPSSSSSSSSDDDDDEAAMSTTTTQTKLSPSDLALANRLTAYNAAITSILTTLSAQEDLREAWEWSHGPAKAEWESRLLRRRRAEVVLWGVGDMGEKVMEAVRVAADEPGAGGVVVGKAVVEEQPAFRREMGPKRIRFSDGEESSETGKVAPSPAAVQDPAPPQQQKKILTLSKPKAPSPTLLTLTKPRPPTSTSPPLKLNPPAPTKRKRKRSQKDRAGAIPDDNSSSGDDDFAAAEREEEAVRERKRVLRERLERERVELERARWEVEEVVGSESESGSKSEEEVRPRGRGGGDGGEVSESESEGSEEGSSEGSEEGSESGSEGSEGSEESESE